MSISSSHTSGLHSRYDPMREAEKFLAHSEIPTDSKIYILLEPGKGYLSQILHYKNPSAKILEVHCSSEFQNRDSRLHESIKTWHPDYPGSLSSFLSKYISDFEIGEIKIVEWPPAARVYGDDYVRTKEYLRSFLQERRATVHTTGKFGRVWIKNTLKRLARLPSVCTGLTVNAPVLIAASGPTLNQSIPLLKELEHALFIISLPSSLATLTYHGISPDIVVHSDPGYYAEYHLRKLSTGSFLQAAPLYAAGYTRLTDSLLILATGSPLENYFIKTLNTYAETISPHGTVAGLAYQLAQKISSGPIIFAGLDFCFNDIQSHARPHSFEEILQSVTHRYKNIHGLYYERSPRAAEKSTPAPNQNFSLERYSQWFQRLPPETHSRFYRLKPSSITIPAFTTLGEEGVRKMCENISKPLFDYTSARIDKKTIRASLSSLEAAVQSQYEQFLLQDTESHHIITQLKKNPLLFELYQCTNLPLLFRIQKGSADKKDLLEAYPGIIGELHSISQAVLS